MMSKTYTKKQIQEAISYWKKQLDIINEANMTREQYDELFKSLKSGEVEFDFVKKDGTKRHARGTLNPKLMPPENVIRKQYIDAGEDYDALMTKLEQRKIYMPYFWDLDKGGYRQFHISRFVGFTKTPQKRKFRVTTLWYKPTFKTDIIEAYDKTDAENQINASYANYTKSRSESDELFEGIDEITEIN